MEHSRASCPFFHSDPDQAKVLARDFTFGKCLVDGSHFGAHIRNCPGCGQPFLHLFMELIDWVMGDDSQATITLPLTPEQAEELESREVDEAFLDRQAYSGRHLLWSHPSGKEPYTRWLEGRIHIMRHD